MDNHSRLLIIFVAAFFTMFQLLQPVKAIADSTVVTQNKPQIMGTPEEEIIDMPTEGKKSNTLVWLGAIVGVVAIAALVGAGGSGGGDGGTVTPPPDNGDVAVSW